MIEQVCNHIEKQNQPRVDSDLGKAGRFARLPASGFAFFKSGINCGHFSSRTTISSGSKPSDKSTDTIRGFAVGEYPCFSAAL